MLKQDAFVVLIQTQCKHNQRIGITYLGSTRSVINMNVK